MKVLFIDSNHPTLKSGLEDLGCTCEEAYKSSKQEIENIIDDYHGIVIRSRIDIDKPFIDKASKLKFIARVGSGLDSIDVDYAGKKVYSLFQLLKAIEMQ